MHDAAEVSAGQFYSCARTVAAGVDCWGLLDSDAGGSPNADRVFVRPVPIAFPEPVAHVAANGYGSHNCAVTRRGNLYCWGSNVFGQLGDGTTTSRDTPARIGEAH
jgi:alpha-tubulin suppressor-like RCC1 family protein